MTRKIISLPVLLLTLLAFVSCNEDWEMKQAPLMTAFAEDVAPGKIWLEYPRPQLVREEWMNLNGLWQFQPGTAADEAYPEGDLERNILVPFPVESALSGIMERHDRLWYRRTFNVPSKWNGQRIMLNFEAVDWETEVFINGTSIGIHKGGYDPFSFDITDHLSANKKQEITVRVFDPTNLYGQARGKQSLTSYGIMYTSTSGIWQTVWLEPVPEQHIEYIKLVPDIDEEFISAEVFTSLPEDADIKISVKDNGKEVANMEAKASSLAKVSLPDAKLWSPDSPFLYDVTIQLLKNKEVIDEVSSYIGMRKISIEKVGDVYKTFLNNEFLFQMGPLDQGFWPDGTYTAPGDKALKYDIEMMKAMGYNMVRKHIKVEPRRWYYWTDKLGLMVWQDMPSINSYNWGHYDNQPIDTAQFKVELEQMVVNHINSPSIVTWVLFNEAQGQHDTHELVSFIRSLDPSRLINQASGGHHKDAGDIFDVHPYPAPFCPESKTQILAVGEYGGIGLPIEEHLWAEEDNPYANASDPDDLIATYEIYGNMLIDYKINNGLSCAVYTEITDVETEVNGMMTYDRIAKVDTAALKRIHERIIKAKGIRKTIILDNALNKGMEWQYTFEKPEEKWTMADFDDSAWKTGTSGFGTVGSPGAIVATVWDTEDIWLRKEFELGELSEKQLENLAFNLHHDDAGEVYLNGVLAANMPAWTSNYVVFPIRPEAKETLVQNGKTIIAIHCHQDQGGQFIDAGIMSFEIVE